MANGASTPASHTISPSGGGGEASTAKATETAKQMDQVGALFRARYAVRMRARMRASRMPDMNHTR
jgi:hypothetical protein